MLKPADILDAWFLRLRVFDLAKGLMRKGSVKDEGSGYNSSDISKSTKGAKAWNDIVLHSPASWRKSRNKDDIIQVHVLPRLLHRLLLPNPPRIFSIKENSYLGFPDPTTVLVSSCVTKAKQSRYELPNIRKPRHQSSLQPQLATFRLIKSFANTLSKTALSKLLRSFISQTARDLVKLIVRDDRILLQAVLPTT